MTRGLALAGLLALAAWLTLAPGTSPPAPPAPPPATDAEAEAEARAAFTRAADELARGHFLAGRRPRDWDEKTRGRHRVPHLAKVADALLSPLAELKWKRYLATLSDWLAILREPKGGRPGAPAPLPPAAHALLEESGLFLAGHVLVDFKTLHEVVTNALKYPTWDISDRPRAEVLPAVKRAFVAMKAEGEVFVAHRLRDPDPPPVLLRLEALVATLVRSTQAAPVLARLEARLLADPAGPDAAPCFDHLLDLLEETEDRAALSCIERGARLDALLPLVLAPPPGLEARRLARMGGKLLKESVRLGLLCGRDATPSDLARVDALIARVPSLEATRELGDTLAGILGLPGDDELTILGDAAMPGLGPRLERIRTLAAEAGKRLSP